MNITVRDPKAGNRRVEIRKVGYRLVARYAGRSLSNSTGDMFWL